MPPLDFEQFRKDVAAAQSPEEKLNRYIDISLQVARYHPDSLFTFAEEIRNLKGLEPARQKAFEHFILANAWRAFNRDSAIYYGVKAAKKLKKINQHEHYLRTKNLLGLEYRRQSDYLKAEVAFLEGLNYSLSLDSAYYPIHYFYGNLGNLYSAVGAYDLGASMFEKFMEYEDSPQARCNILSRLAGNLMRMNELKKAEKTLAPCLEVKNLPPPLQSITRSNLSEIVGKMGQKERSLILMEEAASVSVKYKIPNLHIAHLIRLGNQYLEMNQVRKADSIRIIINKTDFRGFNRHFTIEKALFFSNLALATGNYKSTIAYADSAIQIAGPNNNLKFFLKKVYATKAKAYEKLGKMDLAVKSLRLQDKLDEQQITKEKIRSDAMMKVRYQLQNQEEELALASNRLNILSKRNLFLLALVIVTGLAGGFIYSRYRKSRSNEEIIADELQERDVTISELEEKITEQNRKLKERNIPEWVAFNSQVKLSLDEIRYIQSEGNYVKIYLSDLERAPMMERLTLKQCEQMLPEELTMRIHRSTIVNLRHVSHITNEILFLKDNTELKISRRYKKDLINSLG
ncbi:MAG TPA: LytTR family DNA-binding domain-containing protein [Balneolaceae bacterium]